MSYSLVLEFEAVETNQLFSWFSVYTHTIIAKFTRDKVL